MKMKFIRNDDNFVIHAKTGDYKLKLLVTKCCNFPDQSCLKGEEKDKKKENDKDDSEKVRSSEEKL